MNPLVYYYCIDLRTDQVASIETSLRKLEELMTHPPLEVECSIARLPYNIQTQIMDDLDSPNVYGCAGRVCRTLADEIERLSNHGFVPRLIVCCPGQHPLVTKCLAANPDALWGVTVDNSLAVVYQLSNHYAIWHELLHLLGAKDCYDVANPAANAEPTCEHRQCIMQYAATEGVVDGCLPICDGNVSRIKSFLERVKD